MSHPLRGVRVVEMGSYLAGPYAATQLGDLGADVIKIEPVFAGDKMREAAPFVDGESSAFLLVNRNKRSLTLDLRTTEGLDIARALMAKADIVVQNLRPGSAAKLGLGYEDVREINSDIIYVSASGWGESGPLASLPGLDIMAQAHSGLMSITGPEGGEPCKVGVPICDLLCGIYGALGALAALRYRDETGEGQHVEVNLLETGVSLAIWEAARYFVTRETPGPQGSAHGVSAPYQAVKAADGSFVLGATTDAAWKALCGCLGRDDLYQDRERYGDKNRRRSNRSGLIREIESVTLTRSVSHWVDALRLVGVPCAVINRYDKVFSDEHLTARGFFWNAPHPKVGHVRQLGSAMRLSGSPTRRANAGPTLGQHSREILHELGWESSQIDELEARGITSTVPQPGRDGRAEHQSASASQTKR